MDGKVGESNSLLVIPVADLCRFDDERNRIRPRLMVLYTLSSSGET